MAKGYYRRTKTGKRGWVRASGGSLSMRRAAGGKKPTLGGAIRYWNSLPDAVRYKRMAKNEGKKRFGKFGVPISAKKLKRRGFTVFEDGSIARRRR